MFSIEFFVNSLLYGVGKSNFLMQAIAGNIKLALQQFPEDKRDEVVLLFSAHSLPLAVSCETERS